MLTGYFSSLNDLKIEEVQFITAIALDNLGEIEAAKVTLNLFSSDKNFESPMHPANVLQNELLKNQGSLLLGFIETLYSKPLVQVRNSSVYATHDLKTVSHFIKRTTSSELYNHTMKLIATYDKGDYLVLYMQTNMWYKSFSAVAGIKTASISAEAIERLNAYFTDYVNRYSKDGKYSIKTRNPDAFLIAAFNNYIKGKKIYYDLISVESVLKASSDEDGRSLLDKFADDDRYDTANNVGRGPSIDFVNIAEKIYKASYCLYNHGDDKGIAYMDILTWYRNHLVTIYKEERSSQLKVIKDYFQVSFENITDGLNQEASHKCRVRNETCAVLYNKMLDGVSIYDVYNLYHEVAKFADSRTNGNSGTTLFSYGEHTAKKGTNQQKFQDMYEGFIALQQLINYLNSPKNTTGYDVFNFPVDIFRDRRLLSRFHTLEDYLLLHDDVINLLREVSRDPSRSKSLHNELYSNETVYTKLLEYNKVSLDINKLLTKASKLNLSSGAYITEDNPAETFNKVIYKPLYKFIEDANKNREEALALQRPTYLREQLKGTPVVILYKAVYYIHHCYSMMISNVYSDVTHTNAALACINVVDIMCEQLGHPINNSNGISTISGKGIADILDNCGVPKEPALHKNISTDKFCWFDFICKVFTMSVYHLCAATIKDIPIEFPFNLARLVNGAILAIDDCKALLDVEISTVMSKKNVEPNMYLVYAKVISEAKVLNLNYPIEEASELIQYLDSPYIVDATAIDTMDYQDIRMTKQRNMEAIVEIANKCIKHYEPLFIVFKEFLSNAKCTLSSVGSSIGVSANKYRMMANLSLRIESEFSRNEFANRLYKLCQNYNCHYDTNGYLMKNRDYVTLDNGTCYVHRFGYKVLPGTKDDFWVINVDPEINPLTQDDEVLIDISVRSM